MALEMEPAGESDVSRAPVLALEAIRIAEQSARAAERSAAGALTTLERAESSLAAGEQRMAEITAAASSAASEATEARLRATEVAAEFRVLEARVNEALLTLTARGSAAPGAAVAERLRPETSPARPPARPPAGPPPPTGSTTVEFEALWDSFDRKADRIVARLKALEARTMKVIGPERPSAGFEPRAAEGRSKP